MNERRLGITPTAIEASKQYVDPFVEETKTPFVLAIDLFMTSEQPELRAFMDTLGEQADDPKAFLLGRAMAYSMIPTSTRLIPLKGAQVISPNQRIDGIEYEEDDTEETGFIIPNLLWFADQLAQDSPEFMDWLEETARKMEDPNTQRDFYLGALLTTMPFYMRDETIRAGAERLAAQVKLSHANTMRLVDEIALKFSDEADFLSAAEYAVKCANSVGVHLRYQEDLAVVKGDVDAAGYKKEAAEMNEMVINMSRGNYVPVKAFLRDCVEDYIKSLRRFFLENEFEIATDYRNKARGLWNIYNALPDIGDPYTPEIPK